MSAGRFLQQAAAGAGAGGSSATYADDVFSAYVYNGTSSSQVVHNGILLGDGPADYTVFHLTGDSLVDAAPIASTLSNNSGVSISTSDKKYGSGSMQFTKSSNGYVRSDAHLASPRGDEDFTMEAWIKINGSHTNYNFIYGHSYPQQFFVDNNGYVLYYTSTTDSSSGYINLSSSSTVTQITTGTWTHVAVTRRGYLYTIWIDGVESATTTSSGQAFLNTTVFPTVGNWSSENTTYAFNGFIDDFRITRGLARYTANFTPPGAALPVDTLETGKGGMVWIKRRDGSAAHAVWDTERGAGTTGNGTAARALSTDQTFAEGSIGGTITYLDSFTRSGFTVTGQNSPYNVNGNNIEYASWTFRKQPGFFDVVTWTGDGTSNRNISHNLGSVPGCIIIKNLSISSAWVVYHRSLSSASYYLELNSTAAQALDGDQFSGTAPTDSVFTVGPNSGVNRSGDSFVAYLFAHDAQEFGPDSDESIIKCGSLTTDSSGNASVSLGWEPQWVLAKTVNSSNQWVIVDVTRGFENNGTNADKHIWANSGNAEMDYAFGHPTATGFEAISLSGNQTYIYMAIRRPHKPASEIPASKLFAVEGGDGSSRTAKEFVTTSEPGFMVDMFIQPYLPGSSGFPRVKNRLTGQQYLAWSSTAQEASDNNYRAFDSNRGILTSLSTSTFSWTSGHHFLYFRRAPGFFDAVTYTGGASGDTNLTPTSHAHNLGVAPELIILKHRNRGINWFAWYTGNTPGYFLRPNLTNEEVTASSDNPFHQSAVQSADSFQVTGVANNSSYNYIAYLFASQDGVSKIGTVSHTTGSTTDVDCGFSNGARFVLVKRIDNGGGHWVVIDSYRGITSGNDPYLLLSSTSAQTTSQDVIDPLSSGFQMQGFFATGTWLFFAIA
jgi:hypothetical protein